MRKRKNAEHFLVVDDYDENGGFIGQHSEPSERRLLEAFKLEDYVAGVERERNTLRNAYKEAIGALDVIHQITSDKAAKGISVPTNVRISGICDVVLARAKEMGL